MTRLCLVDLRNWVHKRFWVLRSGALEHLGLLKREGFSSAVHTATWALGIQLGVGLSSLGYNHDCKNYKPNKVAANPYNHGYAHQLLCRMITVLRVGWFWSEELGEILWWLGWYPLVRTAWNSLPGWEQPWLPWTVYHWRKTQLFANYKPTIKQVLFILIPDYSSFINQVFPIQYIQLGLKRISLGWLVACSVQTACCVQVAGGSQWIAVEDPLKYVDV